MALIRRYARILRDQQARYRGPRIGARARRLEREAEEAGRTPPESATREALHEMRSADGGLTA